MNPASSAATTTAGATAAATVETNQKSRAAHLRHPIDGSEPGTQVIANVAGLTEDFPGELQDMQGGQCCGCGYRVSAKSGAVLSSRHQR